jgi:hypothetical protein
MPYIIHLAMRGSVFFWLDEGLDKICWREAEQIFGLRRSEWSHVTLVQQEP